MSMFFYLICSFLLVIMSVWCFVSQRKHLLMILLSLEMIALSMLLMLFFDTLDNFLYNFIFDYCVFEGSLGLSVLVSIARSHGNDYLGSLVVL